MASNAIRWTGALVVLLLASPASATTPAERETARQLMQRGDRALAGGDMATAADSYRKADALVGVPTTALALGKAELAQGHLLEALDAFGRARRYPVKTDTPDVLVKARDEATRLDEETAARVPTVLLDVGDVDAALSVKVDGVPYGLLGSTPLKLNPGEHRLEVSADGYFPAQFTVTVAERQRVTEAVSLKRRPSIPKETRSARREESADPKVSMAPEAEDAEIQPWTIAGLAIGGAGLVVAGITGGVAMSQTSALRDRCGGSLCPDAERSAHDELISLSNVSNAMWVVGGLVTAAGVASLIVDLTADKGDEIAISPWAGPTTGGLTIGGSF